MPISLPHNMDKQQQQHGLRNVSGISYYHRQSQQQQQQQQQQYVATANASNNLKQHCNSNNNNCHAGYATKMHSGTSRSTTPEPKTPTASPSSTASMSPPEFDFNMPCGYFKSSFARSLSLNNGGSYQQCKSLDYDVNQSHNHNHNHEEAVEEQAVVSPPLPQRLNRSLALNKKNADTTINMATNRQNDVSATAVNDDVIGNEVPPAIPARRQQMPANNCHSNNNNESRMPQHSDQQQQQQQLLRKSQQQHNLTQFRRHSTAMGNANSVATTHGQCKLLINHMQQQQQQQQHYNQQHHYQQKPQHLNNTNNNNNNKPNDQSLAAVWPNENQSNNQQDFNFNNLEDDDAGLTPPDILLPPPPADQQQQQQQQQQQPTLHHHHHHHHNHQQQHVPRPLSVEQVREQNAALNVEAVLLQTQVDTLQWQLKQAETNCDMYRAVMEEVARFFERYNAQKLQQNQQQPKRTSNMERSKSLYHVYGQENGADSKQTPFSDNEMPASAYLRARSSTNLIDLNQSTPNATAATAAHNKTLTPSSAKQQKCMDDLTASTTNANTASTHISSYNGYKDFTWRRSPKKHHNANDCKYQQLSAADLATELKLNQEAFRLARTIQNLLLTSRQQADLTQHGQQQQQQQQSSLISHRHSLSSFSLQRLSQQTPAVSLLTLNSSSMATPLLNSTVYSNNECGVTAAPSAVNDAVPKTANAATADMLFLRSTAMRDSRLSLRSSTDCSAHSTISSSAGSTSSKAETDEELTQCSSSKAAQAPVTVTSTPLRSNSKQHQQAFGLGSTTEDESGFSSISSYQDIGVPLSSTMLSSDEQQPAQQPQHYQQSADATLKPTTANIHPSNVVGVPMPTMEQQSVTHRWDSVAKTYRSANKYQRFSTLSNDDAAAVLWV